MERVYADLIQKGLKTSDDVPERLRDKVRDLLKTAESGGGNE